MFWQVVLSYLNIDVSFLFCCLTKGCRIWNLITNTLNFLCYFSGLQVHVGEDSYSCPGEVMQCCKTTTQHCREAEELCSSFNLDVQRILSSPAIKWSACLSKLEVGAWSQMRIQLLFWVALLTGECSYIFFKRTLWMPAVKVKDQIFISTCH